MGKGFKGKTMSVSFERASHARPDPLDGTWRVKVEDTVYGPYSGHQMRAFIGEGRIIADSIVKPAASGRWHRAGSDPVLARLLKGPRVTRIAPAQVPPHHAHLGQSAAATGPAANDDAAHTGLADADTAMLQTLAPRAEEGLAGLLDRVRKPDGEDAPLQRSAPLQFEDEPRETSTQNRAGPAERRLAGLPRQPGVPLGARGLRAGGHGHEAGGAATDTVAAPTLAATADARESMIVPLEDGLGPNADPGRARDTETLRALRDLMRDPDILARAKLVRGRG